MEAFGYDEETINEKSNQYSAIQTGHDFLEDYGEEQPAIFILVAMLVLQSTISSKP